MRAKAASPASNACSSAPNNGRVCALAVRDPRPEVPNNPPGRAPPPSVLAAARLAAPAPALTPERRERGSPSAESTSAPVAESLPADTPWCTAATGDAATDTARRDEDDPARALTAAAPGVLAGRNTLRPPRSDPPESDPAAEELEAPALAEANEPWRTGPDDDDPADPDEPDPPSAHATAGNAAIPTPTPRAIARPPTRPT